MAVDALLFSRTATQSMSIDKNKHVIIKYCELTYSLVD